MTKNKTNKVKKPIKKDIFLELLNDSRVSSKHIELYNLASQDYASSKIEDPIYILDNMQIMLQKYNRYISSILNEIDQKKDILTQEQIIKCIDNSYTRYLTIILNIKN